MSRRTREPALRLTNRPLLHTTGATLSLLAGLIPQIAPLDLVTRATLLFCFGGMGAGLLWLTRIRWTRLELDHRLRWRRPDLQLELPREAARRVVITRTRWPLKEPTEYALEVELNGHIVELLVAEHWMWGHCARRRAQRLADALGVELYDDAEVMLRGVEWSPAHRLVYSGNEWAFIVLVLLAVLGGGVLFLAWS